MGWFDEQIRQRTLNDRDVLEDSFFRMADAVMDKWSAGRFSHGRLTMGEALDGILAYYRFGRAEIPDSVTDPGEQLRYALRPTGLMTREVELEGEWYRDAFGPMLCCMKDSGASVAMIPGTVTGYYFRDPSTGKRKRVNRKNAGLFMRDALCFYYPLPMKKLGIPDLLLYMKKSVSHGDLLLVAIASLAVTLLTMLEPGIYGMITGSVLIGRRITLLNGLMVFLVSAAFSAKLMDMTRSLLMEKISVKTSMAVESSVMMRILSLPVSFFRGFSSGELASRAQSVNSLCSMILNNILSIGLSSLMSLLYITQIFTFAQSLVLPSVLIILATVLLSLSASLMQIGITRKKMKLSAKETGMSYAMLGGVQKIKLAGAENRMFARWGRLYAEHAALEYNPPAFLKLNKVLITAISLIGNVALYYIAISTGVTPGGYFTFMNAYGHVMAAFSALAGVAVSIASIKPILEMAEPILKAEPEVAAEKENVTSLTGNIEMNHITFRYEENTPYVIRDLTLKIKAGEYVAIVGRTGCGKSTLVRLLLGFEKPENGAIYYDRYDLSHVDPRSLRKHIGVVIQNSQLFQGDIYSNIVISAPHLTLAEAWEAAESAGIAEDIREMPMGMQTIISEGQGGVSGGQKQRLMIARAIAPKPRILIFDEATSALDNRTQRRVSDALARLRCTRIVIAHRLSTVRDCDRILVMDEGAIIEEGTYDELIAKNGVFADLVARQRLEGADSAETT